MNDFKGIDYRLNSSHYNIRKLDAKISDQRCPMCHERKLTVNHFTQAIECSNCTISFKYRIPKGIIPYYAVQIANDFMIKEV
jgi:transcription elongation factor Elf1